MSYPGQPYTYPVSGFWPDSDLQALLEQVREADIVRAAYRAEPFTHVVDLWLLTNIPTELRVTNLLTSDDVLGLPAGRLASGPRR